MANLINNSNLIWFSNKPTDNGIYRYDVMVNGELVFIGNTYLEGGKNPIIDVTDIVKNYVDVNKPPFSTIGEKSNIYKTIEVKLYINGAEYRQGINKFMIYANPQFNSSVSTPILDSFTTQNISTMPMLQGWDYNANKGYLIPTYPAVASDSFTFDMVCAYQNMPFVNTVEAKYNSGNIGITKDIQISGSGVYQYSLPLSWILGSSTTTICDIKSIDIVAFSPIQSGIRYRYTIANFDTKSRYFLKWKDRYGMPQVQPFGGTHKYGESITKNTIVNYLNTKKIIDISNTPKWLLNTKWIKQEYYPFYESIFVSPYLQLYDAVEDKIYNVILKNTEYEEKTFNNQNKQLFNLQLEVELDTTEYMIY